MRKIEYVVSDERLITPSGLSLVGQVLGKSNLIKKATVPHRHDNCRIHKRGICGNAGLRKFV